MAVSMVKGQRISLEKPGGGQLTLVRMGLGWDPVKRKGLFGSRQKDVDLDASCVLFADKQPAAWVYYGQLTSQDGSVRHTGDNLTGDGSGDDESIIVDLTRVPVHVTSIVFTVTSYQGQTFAEVENAYCRLVDETTGTELARYTLDGGNPVTGYVMSRLYRHNGEWKLAAIGEAGMAKTFNELMPIMAEHL